MNAVKTNNAPSTPMIVLLAAGALVLLCLLFFGTNGINSTLMYWSSGITISTVLLFLVKVLLVVFLAFLGIGVFIEGRKIYEKHKQEEQEQKPVWQAASVDRICMECGNQMSVEWKHCPNCGAAKVKVDGKDSES